MGRGSGRYWGNNLQARKIEFSECETAPMIEPYKDRPETSGLLVITEESLRS